MSKNDPQSQALDKLVKFLRKLPKKGDPPFEKAVELGLAAGMPEKWLGFLDGQVVNLDFELTFMSLGLRLYTMSIVGDSITITEEHGPGTGNIIMTGPCPWYMFVEPLNQWLEKHPEWMKTA